MYLVYDITNFISWFFSSVLSIASSGFAILDDFKFFGASILDYWLTFGILVALVVVVLPHNYNGSVVPCNLEK